MTKKQEIEFTDEYFLNLTMDYDKRDAEIYQKWAMWCALSEDKYYIDGKEGHFYTHIRTDREITIERKHRIINNLLLQQELIHESESDWNKYEKYIQKFAENDDLILEFIPITYEEWKDFFPNTEESGE